MRKMLFTIVLGGLSLSSCSSDDDVITDQDQLEVPANYVFERDESSTISYSGQTLRLRMAKELISSFNEFDNISESSLSGMFSNQNDPFSSAELNESSKSVKSKVAASTLYFSTNSVESNEIKDDFESFISEHVNEVAPNENQEATAGVAGQIYDGSVRYVNPKGLELNQAFAKGLIGALISDQILNNYLSEAVLDAGGNIEDNSQKNVEEGKNYTTMEHKWDEAYGYLYGDPSVPAANPNTALADNEDAFLFKYLARVDNDSDFAGIAEETFEAFKKGRAAIVAGDLDLRDEQVAIIRENISKIIAIRAVYYLQDGKKAIENDSRESAFHGLSEGYGFVYSLRFTHNPDTNAPYVSKAEIDTALEALMDGDGFWDVTPETLDVISQEIAGAFGFSVEMAAE